MPFQLDPGSILVLVARLMAAVRAPLGGSKELPAGAADELLMVEPGTEDRPSLRRNALR